MKFKLDENFGTRTLRIFRDSGPDVATVREEELQGSTDLRIYEVCRAENRCLVALDLDFADVTRFPPEQTAGIAVIRVPQNPSLSLLEQLIRQFLTALTQTQVNHQLWIIEIGRLCIRQTD